MDTGEHRFCCKSHFIPHANGSAFTIALHPCPSVVSNLLGATACPATSRSQLRAGPVVRQLFPKGRDLCVHFFPLSGPNRPESKAVGRWHRQCSEHLSPSGRADVVLRPVCQRSASGQRRSVLPTMIRGTDCRGPARRMCALHVGDSL